jgi:hypothetical protein
MGLDRAQCRGDNGYQSRLMQEMELTRAQQSHALCSHRITPLVGHQAGIRIYVRSRSGQVSRGSLL